MAASMAASGPCGACCCWASPPLPSPPSPSNVRRAAPPARTSPSSVAAADGDHGWAGLEASLLHCCRGLWEGHASAAGCNQPPSPIQQPASPHPTHPSTCVCPRSQVIGKDVCAVQQLGQVSLAQRQVSAIPLAVLSSSAHQVAPACRKGRQAGREGQRERDCDAWVCQIKSHSPPSVLLPPALQPTSLLSSAF